MAGLSPEDIGNLVDVGDARLSPDASLVAYVVTTVDLDANCYQSRIWLSPVDGSRPPWPLPTGDGRSSKPRWSPDGSELAFAWSSLDEDDDDDGKDRHALRVAPVNTEAAVRDLAVWPEPIEELAWSPDGTRVAFAARLRDERYLEDKARDQSPRRITRLFYRLDSVGWVADRVRQLFVVASDGSSLPEPVTDGPFQVEGLSWAPDGSALAFCSGRHQSWDLDMATDLFITTLPDGEGRPGAPRRLTETGLAYFAPSWSPDGRRLAFACTGDPLSEPRHAQIGVIDLAIGTPQLLTTSLDRNCAPYPNVREPIWAQDALWFRVEDGGNWHVYRSDTLLPVVAEEREVTGFDVVGDTMVFTATMPTATSELFVVDLVSGEERRLTTVGDALATSAELVAPVPFTAAAPDGNVVQAWVMAPAGAAPCDGQRYPALLNIHGGPFTQYGNRFFDEFQIQAGAGFAVIYANPRGSSGGTEASARAIRWPEAGEDPGSGWGGVDYDDLMAVVDAAIEQFDFIDPDRLGVLGGSYGGYMTSWIIGHTDRFAAACSERAANNILTLDQNSDIASAFRSYVGVSFLDNPGAYVRQSPITYVKSMTTPVLILHSEDDLRCPVNQADELFVALRLLGREPEMVRFPGESHELSRSGSPRHRVMRMQIILDWFGRHLGA